MTYAEKLALYEKLAATASRQARVIRNRSFSGLE